MNFSRFLMAVLGCALASLPTVDQAAAAQPRKAQTSPATAKKPVQKITAAKPAPRIVSRQAAGRQRVTLAAASSARPATAARVQKVSIRRAVPAAAAAAHEDDPIGAFDAHRLPALALASASVLVTAMVVLDAQQSLSETVRVTDDDIDTLQGSSSRLPVGTELSREEMLRL